MAAWLVRGNRNAQNTIVAYTADKVAFPLTPALSLKEREKLWRAGGSILVRDLIQRRISSGRRQKTFAACDSAV